MEKIFSKLKYHLKEIFSVEGRIEKKLYICYFFVVLAMACLSALIIRIPRLGVGTELALDLMVMFLAGIMLFCLSTRRLHDLNLSGWWFSIPAIFALCLGEFFSVELCMGCLILMFSALCRADGTKGANDYGDEPSD